MYKEVADMRQYTDRLIQARTAINPEQGEAERFRLALLRLNAERGKSIQSDQDYHDFVEAEKKRHFETLEQLEQERLDSQRKLFENLSSAEKTQVLGSIGNDFLNAFQKNVGSYIQLNDDMTKAVGYQADLVIRKALRVARPASHRHKLMSRSTWIQHCLIKMRLTECQQMQWQKQHKNVNLCTTVISSFIETIAKPHELRNTHNLRCDSCASRSYAFRSRADINYSR